ncbi:hypothetical protein [Methanimicrococcus blatticola]|uniref:Uncharacterized protein n=1 Tax=Methanimicrococcus blatticola TaxID=91560 RepID=A0A484F4C7_9EURY|nr:hypothetical protein [Methanimicrococcus blatticola]MBZ3935938.1 hypothetical protein [Methanimicrococcus blatticola]MCC2509449.1 hypothetical protein [Methanimicrococcus blatticola]TDQ68328.1 hypothetical protein C7391_1271 [Methanimicrococcus blatticola]
MLVLLLLLTAVLSCVGCIESSSEKEEDTVMKCSKPFVNASISCSQNEDGEIICNVVYWIYDNYEIDEENATFNISGNTVQIHLPTVKYENYDDSCYRYFEATEINLGKKELFEEQGMYFVSLEGNPNQIGKFIFENGSLYNFAPARVEAIQIVQDKNMIKTVVKTLTGDEQIFTIDVENATYSDNFDENKTFTIQVSEKKLDYKELMTFIGVFSTQEFEIMPLDDLENGNYTIKVNDQEATFVVRNHNIVRIYNFEK